MSGWQDPDDPRQWWIIGPLLLVAAGFLVLAIVRGSWLVLLLIAGATAFSAWGTWQSGRPLWPGGPRKPP